MKNQIKELKNENNNEFIIEIFLILIESQKKITISLFINASVTVLELKKFISKDFEFPIQDMIFFYPLKGIIDNNYIFPFEPNKIISLCLIIDDKKKDRNKKMNEIGLYNNNFIKYPNTFIFNNNLLNKQNNFNNLINLIKKDNINNINTFNKIENLHQKINNSYINKEFYSINNSNYPVNKILNINDKNTNFINENINKNVNISNNEIKNINLNLNQIKNNKCNFILTKIDNKPKISNDTLLGKKRNIPTTFKTTILNKENENIKSKNLLKTQNNNNFKVVNFNINKNLSNENKTIKSLNFSK
jgi:hypothetical protein